jgi:hypothetical protein
MTRRMWISAIASALGSFAFVASVQAELTPYFSYTVPGLSNSVQQIDLADVDGDGSAEVLVFDGQDFVLYSPAGESTLATFNVDSIFASLTAGDCEDAMVASRLLLADIDRDSLVDVALLLSELCVSNPYLQTYDARYLAVLADDVATGAAPVLALDFRCESTLGIGYFGAVDIDGDGYDNLVISVDSSQYWDYGVLMQFDNSYGKTLIYHSFPDSLISQVEAVVTAAWPVVASGGNPALLAADRDWSWQDYTGIGPQATTTDGVTLLRPDGETLSHRERQAFEICTDNGDGAIWTNLLHPHWVGDVVSATPEVEVLCTHYDDEHAHDCDTSARALLAYELTDADTLRELWSIDMGDEALTHFMADPKFPDQFFAFAGDTLMRFAATDGSLLKRYDPLPTGMKFWDYPYGEDEPYLVLVNGQTVSYYTFDEVTDVETNTPSALPETFTLGQPYPNPFNPTVTVPVTLPNKGHLRVEVFNILGQPVGVLYDGKAGPGEMNVVWDATDFSSGVYFFKVVFNDLPKTVSAVLVK